MARRSARACSTCSAGRCTSGCRRSPRVTRTTSSIEENVAEAQEWLATGLQGLKTGFGKRGSAYLGFDHDRDVEYVRQMREGLGADKLLMIDIGRRSTGM